MRAVPHRSEAEIRANATFDALLWALSRPGLPRTMPEAGEAPIIEALIDRECRVFSADPRLIPQIMRTGAAVADLAMADHVFLGHPDRPDLLDDVRRGSDLYPDDAATVIVRAEIGRGPVLHLTGPGVDGTVRLRLGGLPEGLWQKRAERVRYPVGFDLFLLDGATVIGVPRSTLVEVL